MRDPRSLAESRYEREDPPASARRTGLWQTLTVSAVADVFGACPWLDGIRAASSRARLRPRRSIQIPGTAVPRAPRSRRHPYPRGQGSHYGRATSPLRLSAISVRCLRRCTAVSSPDEYRRSERRSPSLLNSPRSATPGATYAVRTHLAAIFFSHPKRSPGNCTYANP